MTLAHVPSLTASDAPSDWPREGSGSLRTSRATRIPGTPIEMLTEVLPYSDFVLLMSVNPGFGGQSFIPTMTDKLRRLKQMIISSGSDVRIEIDGGIDERNIGSLVAAGAEMIVAGSAVFGKEDPAEAVRSLIAAGTSWV